MIETLRKNKALLVIKSGVINAYVRVSYVRGGISVVTPLGIISNSTTM
jgi:hypothetical protein